jgi:Asp-tRNA(Asn)/Glu-tRNA(Gln) amidotransferase A subunit family amidase
LHELSAAEAARMIEAGELTCEALAAACLERISERDDAVRAWAFIHEKQALATARELDRTSRRSRLHGVPFGLKDIIDTEDLPTEYGSPIYRGHRPRADAACVALLRRAGCLILGKTVSTEFANNHPSMTQAWTSAVSYGAGTPKVPITCYRWRTRKSFLPSSVMKNSIHMQTLPVTCRSIRHMTGQM